MIVIEALKGVSGLFAVARAVHMTSCAALASVFVFERLIARRCVVVPRRAWIIWISLLLIVASGLTWLATATIDMTGLPAIEALTRENLHLVLSTTDFGRLWMIRGGVAACLVLMSSLHRYAGGGLGRGLRRDILAEASHQSAPSVTLPQGTGGGKRNRQILGDLRLLLSILLLGSLAWAGHGRFGTQPATHLIADSMHLLITAIWPGGLLPLWLMLGLKNNAADSSYSLHRYARERAWEGAFLEAQYQEASSTQDPLPNLPPGIPVEGARGQEAAYAVVEFSGSELNRARIASLAPVVNRFSTLALISVVVLIGTGWINSWMLVAEWHSLIDSAYGQALLIKLGLMLVMILLGAVNILYVRPRITQTQNAIRVLRWNVGIETAAAAGIMLVVGYLGLLPPPADPSTIPCCPVVVACPPASAQGSPSFGFPEIGGA